MTCTKKTYGYYVTLGFEEILLVDIFKGETIKSFGKRFNIIEWSNDPVDEHLKIMSITGRIPRHINLVSVRQDFNIEHSLYDKNVLKEFHNITASKEVRQSLKDLYAPLIERIKL